MARTMHVWVFGIGLLVALLLGVIGTLAGLLAMGIWGFVVVPHGALWLRRRQGLAGGDDEAALETHYWRNDRWQPRGR